MKFTELDRKMRVYETANDLVVLPGVLMVARLDGRGFTKLVRERHPFESPFDPRFRDMMVETGRHLMDCGFNFLLCYSQSDEISLLFHPDEGSFGRKLRKLNSVLAGEASAKFSLLLEDTASFDCRISQLPRAVDVVDYFRWRNEDAHRNALNAHCFWLLRKKGQDPKQAQQALDGLSVAAKNELLFQKGGINFNDLPQWEKRGWVLRWVPITKQAADPNTGEAIEVERRQLALDLDLPMRDAFSEMIRSLLE
ncbi:tRNA(His) guanylyltransferase Thg1 family protein [Pelagibius sp.]|uniref:tRNA(His) guanylyltransferase Thg1 family protein n=1 Tax=Pelagibius sp. TaxID=1931238 RepID=UPI0026161ED6|nr:tRNA(His) guanylyltransferase Thg1 family protein [Pelagibius sp.]